MIWFGESKSTVVTASRRETHHQDCYLNRGYLTPRLKSVASWAIKVSLSKKTSKSVTPNRKITGGLQKPPDSLWRLEEQREEKERVRDRILLVYRLRQLVMSQDFSLCNFSYWNYVLLLPGDLPDTKISSFLMHRDPWWVFFATISYDLGWQFLWNNKNE